MLIAEEWGFIITLFQESTPYQVEDKHIRVRFGRQGHFRNQWGINPIHIIGNIINRDFRCKFKCLILDGVVMSRKVLYFS